MKQWVSRKQRRQSTYGQADSTVPCAQICEPENRPEYTTCGRLWIAPQPYEPVYNIALFDNPTRGRETGVTFWEYALQSYRAYHDTSAA